MNRFEDIDSLALNEVGQMLGFSLKGERPVSFYLYFSEEYQAHYAAAALTNLQFDTEIHYSEYAHEWLCLAAKRMNISSGRLTVLSECVEGLVDRYDGTYDGWETMIEPEEVD